VRWARHPGTPHSRRGSGLRRFGGDALHRWRRRTGQPPNRSPRWPSHPMSSFSRPYTAKESGSRPSPRPDQQGKLLDVGDYATRMEAPLDLGTAGRFGVVEWYPRWHRVVPAGSQQGQLRHGSEGGRCRRGGRWSRAAARSRPRERRRRRACHVPARPRSRRVQPNRRPAPMTSRARWPRAGRRSIPRPAPLMRQECGAAADRNQRALPTTGRSSRVDANVKFAGLDITSVHWGS
jgi:hypothetical protein